MAVTCIGLCIGAGYYLGGIIATIIVYLILSYSHKISDKLEHFDVLEFHIKISKESALNEIEDILSRYEVNIKEVRKSNKDEKENIKKIIIVGEYNKKNFNRNKLLNALSLIKSVDEVTVE